MTVRESSPRRADIPGPAAHDSSLTDVDPSVRKFLRTPDQVDLKPQVVDPKRLGAYPHPTPEQFVSARSATLESVRELAARLPMRDDLFVDLDRVGGRLMPYILAASTGQLARFNPDKVNYTSAEIKSAALETGKKWKGKNAKDLLDLAGKIRSSQR